MVFDVMNLDVGLADFDHNDLSVEQIAQRYEGIKPFLTNMVLKSDGSMRKGRNPFLFTKKGFFDISDEFESCNRFYWSGDTSGYPYFFKKNKVFIGYDANDGSHMPPISAVLSPLLSLKGLYRKNDVDEFKVFDYLGSFTLKDNTDEKIDFLENFLEKEDKSGYKPQDMVVKNTGLRLKLLEKHYENNVDFYSFLID